MFDSKEIFLWVTGVWLLAMSVDRDPNENDRGPSGAEVLASLITDALEKAKLVSWSQSFFIKLSIIVEKNTKR